ncbi:sensor domain-containing diguanylate cyclase [Aeromonas dhakensis]|uniref:sensor domain-containing diguanylate cyclase n=1 Tax=Aeromonas dhakensis TaxID=196024 RepID=UPI0003600639|nr:diguanylate cyclase [Aeromonas dhakensis]MCR6740431.1 diguanylate cyclase [Aeromonas dhakensis]MDX7833679.1 diguanylate cyclase [Aeromonas dhakensis]USP10410.1 diguanylate cyclase [Aeromonas dhakensis]
MAQPSRSIDHLLAYSMFPVWAGAILMLLIVIALAQVPAAQRVEERRMEEHLQRVIRAVQNDIGAMNAFTRDWGIWDQSYHFLAHPNQAYINSNLLVDTPMRDFELNVLSYMDLQGSEIWTRTLLPDAPDTDTTLLPSFLDDLKLQLLRESRQAGISSLSGVRRSQWGPLIFSLQPVTDTLGSVKPNGYLLATRWLDKRYLQDLGERTALTLTIAQPRTSEHLGSFKPLGPHMSYRLVDLGLQQVRGEGLLLDNDGEPVLTLIVDEERDVLLGAMEGAIWTFIGMLLISFACILMALARLRAIVLGPIGELVGALHQFTEKQDASVLPIIDSSQEMALLSRKFREMAARISLHHSALQAHSSRMEVAAYTDPLTHAFNRRYLDEWLLNRQDPAAGWVLVILDLDHFKRVNDRFGHDIGDLLLCQLAELLRGALDEEEPLIRLGGEEFMLLLAREEPGQVAGRIERLRRKIADCRFGREELPLRMTVSLGFCDYPLHAELEDSFWSLSFKLADMALYRAKQEGRDRWRGYSGELGRAQWRLSPEQLAEGEWLLCQASHANQPV